MGHNLDLQNSWKAKDFWCKQRIQKPDMGSKNMGSNESMWGDIWQKNVCKNWLTREILWGGEDEKWKNVEKRKVGCFWGSAFHIRREIICLGCPREIKKLYLFRSKRLTSTKILRESVICLLSGSENDVVNIFLRNLI